MIESERERWMQRFIDRFVFLRSIHYKSQEEVDEPLLPLTPPPIQSRNEEQIKIIIIITKDPNQQRTEKERQI